MDKNNGHLPVVNPEGFFRRDIFLVLFISLVDKSLMGTRNVLNRIGKVFLQANRCFLNSVKSIRIQKFFGPYFPKVGLKTEIEITCMQSECRKVGTRKIFHRYHRFFKFDFEIPIKYLINWRL